MKENDNNSRRNRKNIALMENPLIELKLINSSDEETKDDKSNIKNIDNLFPQDSNNSLLPRKTLLKLNDSQSEEEDEDKKDSCNLFPANFFSFSFIFYILLFLLLFLSSLNFSYVSLPYTIIPIILCLLSNLPEDYSLYYILYILRIFLFPFVCIYSLGLIIFKIILFSKFYDNDSYAEKNKDFLLNVGIFYILENKNLFNIIRSIGPEITLFVYTLFFSILFLLAETKLITEYPICFDCERKSAEKTPKMLRRHIKLIYILSLVYVFFNPSFTCFCFMLIFQICLFFTGNDQRDYINKRYCIIKIIIIIEFFFFNVLLVMNNIMQINSFQIKYLINKKDELTCNNAKKLWKNIGISCTIDVEYKDLILQYIGYAFCIICFLSLENLIRILSNGGLVTNDEYYKNVEDKAFIDETEEVSWVVRKVKNLFILLLRCIEEKTLISHLCRIAAIIHINFCQNIYSFFVFLWLFFSFICDDVNSTKKMCLYCLVPVLIISSLCYNLSNFNIFNIDDSSNEKNNKDIFTFLGLKKLNEYFYFSFISCHIFFLLIITFISSLDSTISLYRLKSYNSEKNIEKKESVTGVLQDISKLSVDSLISVSTKKSNKRKKKKNVEEKNFENNFKNLLQKKINIDSKKNSDNKNKDENLKIINILAKKILMNINKINLILVYLVSISSINIIHLILVIIFVLNVVSSILASKRKKNKQEENESTLQYYVVKLTLIILQLCFLFEFFVDLYKCFFIYSKTDKEKENIANIMKFILYYKEEINSNSCETLIFIITYFYYFEYQIYLIKNKQTNHKDLEDLLNNQNISFYSYFKSKLKYTFFIYEYFVNIMNHIFIWLYTFIFIFFLCHFELNILFSIQLLLFLITIYLLLTKIQTSINNDQKFSNKKIDIKYDIIVSYIFLIFSVSNTIVVYLYQFICHDFWFNKINGTFLVNEKLSYIGLKKYNDDLYLKLLPFFVVNFVSTLFLNELDNYQKKIQKNNVFYRKSYVDNLNKKEKKENFEIMNSNKKLNYTELYEKNKNEIFNIKMKLFGLNIILMFTKIYWIFLFLTICILFNSYYFSLSIAIYIIIFGITFIRMFHALLNNRNNYNLNNNNKISDESLEVIERIKINRNNREISFRFLVGYSFLIFFFYYIYGIFDISISYCEPTVWIGCDNNVNITKSENNSDTIELIKSISFIFGVYYDTKKNDMLSVGWVHLFLCFLFCFDVYIQKIENFFNNIKTKNLIVLDEKTLDSIWLRQKSLESQVDSLIHPNNVKQKNKRSSVLAGSLRDEIGKKIVEDLSGAIKMFNLYKINQKRIKEGKKVMISIKYIFEEIIILVLIISCIAKINVWSIMFIICIFYLIFTKRSVKKFFYFFCFCIIGIIIQIILFVTNIQKSILPRETDEKIFELIEKHLGIPWFFSKDHLFLSFIFGIGIDKNQTNTIYYEYLLIAIIYVYLENFSYNAFFGKGSYNKNIVSFVKGNILYDCMIDNPSLKNREININKNDFAEIKRVVKKNTFIENVSAIRYDDFLVALKKLNKKYKNKDILYSQEKKSNIISERQKLLIKLNSKTQQIFNLFEFIKIILYLSSHNFILIINILISMMIPGIISLIYIIIFISLLFKSNSLIQGKKYYYPHFTKYLRIILLIDISLQLLAQFFMDEGLISRILNTFGINKLLEFKDDEVIKHQDSFALLIAKTISYFFISLQILIYSSTDYIEYYFIYLLTLRVTRYKMAKINAFRFNNERIDVINKSLSLKEEAYSTMNEIQFLLEDWKKMFTKRTKKLSIKRTPAFKMIKEEDEFPEFVNDEEAKKTIKNWIMDSSLIKIYKYIHKFSSPYQNLGNNEMYELEKNIIQGETRPITYIEFLIDFYLDALSPFQLTEQGLSIVEAIINGKREEHLKEIKKIREKNAKIKEQKFKENENLKKKFEELEENVKRIDTIIENLKEEVQKENENKIDNEDGIGRKESGNLSFTIQNLIQKKDIKINPEENNEKKDDVIVIPEGNFPNIDKKKLLSNYEKAKKIILEEEEKICKKIEKYEDYCEREEKHNRNKYLDDEYEFDGVKIELNKINLNDEKFLKFEILRKNSLLFTRYLKNTFILSCILLDLKSCLTYNFHWFCYLFMIINHMHSASLISSFYPLTIFCYALLEHPRPVRAYWKIALYYSFLILFLKLLFTLKIFNLFTDEENFINFLNTLNNYKIGFKYCKLTLTHDFFSYIIFDILVIVSLMININILVINGTWNKREQEIECIYTAMERVSISKSVEIKDEEIKDFNKEFLSSSKIFEKMDLNNVIDEKKVGLHRRKGKVSFIDENLEKKLKSEEKKEKREKLLKNIDEEENNVENKEIKRNYFQRLFPRNRNEKPGGEYYPMYTAAMILILAYILFFFNYMVKDENYASLSLDVQQFNGLMVIYFILHVIILFCDRAILLFQNQKNMKYKYYLYNKNDFKSIQNIKDFRKKSKCEKNEYFKNNLNIVEDNLIELYPKKKRWKNHSLVIPIQHFSELRNKYNISYKQIENFNKPLFFKYLLYMAIVIFVHVVTFISFPMKGNINLGYEVFCTEGGKCNDFTSNKSLIFFYIFYLFYLIPSALQIKYGFNEMKKKSILRRNHNEINSVLVDIFLQIPFLNEIKNIFDWTLTSTSLDLGQWIQFESIYEAIFGTYSDDRDEENVIGQKIEKARKIQKGGLLSFILISALILPMVIFSSINPTNIINSVYDAKLKVDLSFTYNDDEIKKYTLFENNRPETITEMSKDIFEEFNYTKSVKTRKFPKDQIQVVKFYETSDTNWDLVLPHIQTIINELNITDPDNKISSINLLIQTQFTRPLPAEAQIVTNELTAEIYKSSNPEETNKALKLSNALVNCLDTYIDFPDVYTPSRKLSSSLDPIILEDPKYFSSLGIQLGFMGCDNSTGKNNFLQSYFTLKAFKNNNNKDIKTNNTDTKHKTEPLSFHLFSSTISPTTSSYSVYAFYTAVILVFGEYVRDFCSGEPEKVMLNEMPEPKKMVDLCEGITIARNTHDFRMEKKLYFILIELLREPTYLREITKSSVERFEEREQNNKFITTDDDLD